MNTSLTIIQIILCLLLSSLIFMQSKGSTENNNILSETVSQRRGWEKILFNLTLVTILLFLISSVIQSLI